MRHLLGRFKKTSITKQYLVLLSCSFLVILLLSFLILFQARQAVIQTGNEFAAMFSGSLSTELSAISTQAKSICEQMLYDANATSLLKATNWSEVDVKILDEIRVQKVYFNEANPNIADISFFSPLINWTSLYNEESLLDMAAAVTDARMPVCLGIKYGTFVNSGDTPYLVFGAPSYSDYRQTGYIFVSIHPPQISVPADRQEAASAVFLMVDEGYETYAFNCDSAMADEIIRESGLREELFAPDAPESRTDIILEEYVVSYQYVKAANCYIISAVDTDKISERLRSINLLCITMIAATVLLLMAVYLALYRNYIIPIRNFNGIIRETEANNRRTIKGPLGLQGCEEIRQIGDSFTSLLTSINELNRQIVRNANDLYEMELQQKTAELNYLRSQINPHFIYNTLELIRGIATEYAAPQIGQISVSMGKILRYSIKGGHIVPLQQEVDIGLAYFHIQQARFPQRFTMLKNIQPRTARIPVIKMLLQPLVENAVFHGLEPKEGSGTIFLNSTLEGDILKIAIRDNGVGIPAGKLAEIRYALASPVYDTSRSVGLANINARIRLQYGQEYGMLVDSMEGDGTCVTLLLPARGMAEEGAEKERRS